MTGPVNKVTENLLRRIADRQGWGLHKSRMRDPQGIHFGLYKLENVETGEAYFDDAAHGVWLTAGEVSRALGREDVLTNGHAGRVPVVAIALAPDSVDSGEVITRLIMSRERAQELIEALQASLQGGG